MREAIAVSEWRLYAERRREEDTKKARWHHTCLTRGLCFVVWATESSQPHCKVGERHDSNGKNMARSRETEVELSTSQKGQGTHLYLWPLASLSLFTITPSKHAVKEEKATHKEERWRGRQRRHMENYTSL